MSVCLQSVHPSIWLSIYLSPCLSINPSICNLSVCPSIPLSVYFSDCLLVHLFPAVLIGFNQTSYTVMEGEGVVFVRLVKVGTSTRPVQVQLSTVDGSAMGETFLFLFLFITSWLHASCAASWS